MEGRARVQGVLPGRLSLIGLAVARLNVWMALTPDQTRSASALSIRSLELIFYALTDLCLWFNKIMHSPNLSPTQYYSVSRVRMRYCSDSAAKRNSLLMWWCKFEFPLTHVTHLGAYYTPKLTTSYTVKDLQCK